MKLGPPVPQDFHLNRALPLEVTFLVRVDICGGWNMTLVPEGSGFKSRTHDHRFCLSFIYETLPASRSCLILLWVTE